MEQHRQQGRDLNAEVNRRTFLGRSAGLGLSVLAFGGLAACGGDGGGQGAEGGGEGGGGGGGGRIAFGQPDRGADVYAPLIAGAKEAAQQRGYEVVESFSGGDVDKQVAEINTWIAQRLDAIVVLPQDEKAIAPLVDRAHDAGIPFVSYSTPVPEADGIVTFDHAQGAELVAKDVAQWVEQERGGRAKMALLTFDEVETGRVRVRNAEEMIKEMVPGVETVAAQKAILAADALRVSRAILQRDPDINVFVCIADDGCLGVRQALRAAGRREEDVYVTGYDGAKPVMERIIAGDYIKSTAALDLKEIGRQAIIVPANIIEGKQPTSYNAPYRLVTPETRDLAQQLIRNYGA